MVRTTNVYELEDALEAASQEQRNEYYRLWGLTGETYRNFEEYLEKVVESLEEPICARFVWEYLSPDERQVLYHTMSYSARDGLRRDALQKKAQIPPERYEVALNALLQKLLLYEKTEEMDAGKRGNSSNSSRNISAKKGSQPASVIYPFKDYLNTLYNIGREIFTPLGDRSQKSFAELMVNLDTETLYEIHKSYQKVKWGKYYSRSDFGEMLAKVLSRLEEPLDHLVDIEDNTRKLYTWLRQRGGRASMQDIRTYTGVDDSSLAFTFYELESAALAFDTLTRDERVLFIPHDVFIHLRPVDVTNDDTVIVQPILSIPDDFMPAAVRPGEMTILYDLAYVINTIHQQIIEPTQVGRVPKRIATKIRTQLHGLIRPDFQYDDNYLEMLLDIAKEIRLLRLTASPLQEVKDHYEPGDRLSWWSHLDIHGQTAYLLHIWTINGQWDDLPGVYYRAWDPYTWRPTKGRSILLKYLADCTPGRWYTIAGLLQDIWEKDAFAMHPSPTYGRKTISGKTREIYGQWIKGDGETYIGMLASTLYELGIVDLGYDRANALEMQQRLNPTVFMLTELGAATLPKVGEEQALADESARTLIVQPSFELLILQPDMPTLYSILPFAQIIQAGMVSRLTLTRASLLRALENGQNMEHIANTLEKHSQKELPQNVIYSLNDWAKSYKGAKISNVFLIEVSSEAVANQFNTSPKLKTLGLRQLGPFIFALNSDNDLKNLKQVLEQEGVSVQFSGNIVIAQRHPSAIYGMLR